ncbi:hypothetical protein E3U55_16815 [Filobacillus milosensis]|uniref:Uncharacterized protein n=1 Tax=Filobacillus milosensis TaxID=94137 RepID=A0A4Y8IB07_9BACI|nr:hypothetical protein [Filobacillus milosensis]TFB12984.1 hypothetical protein E3U55_16815 [Filobacillus milosensis]
MDLIEKEFSNRAIVREGIYLFQLSDAIDVVNKCKELKLNILGVDSFEIIGNSIMPKEIFHCSINANDGNWSEAIRFIQEPFNQELVFEIVYDN